MENIINIHIEKSPEGLYLATSEDIQGLVAQGRTLTKNDWNCQGCSLKITWNTEWTR